MCLFLCFILAGKLSANYQIRGTVNLKGDWQNLIYLATIDKLDDYYSSSAEHIINVAPIEEDGSFILEGDNLPENAQFYRLYVIKEEHSEFNVCLFVGGEEHNFIHAILDNNSQLEITADTTAFAPFGNYTIEGSKENHLMKSLSEMVYPSHIFYEIRFPSELKFSQDKLNRDLFKFADTASSTLASLAALNNSDFDTYFELNEPQYKGFLKELKSTLAGHPYTKDYLRKLRYYSNDSSIYSHWFRFGTFALGMLSLFLIYHNRKLQRALDNSRKEESKIETSFTAQEIKILQQIMEGKTNKEIASALFIELSTVKSHINKIYSKLKVKSRKEAISKAKNIKF